MSASEKSSSEKTEYIFVAEEYVSSDEPPMEEWSSLVIDTPDENKKKALHELGFYHPGSGEICAKYVAMSDSSVLRHVYYNYPAVLDPGIKKALLNPEQRYVYSDDGQELYLAVCKDMAQPPIKSFSRGLLEKEIDLSYYCVNPAGVRAMAMALNNNKIVKVLILTDNFLSPDSCFHLGQMLENNSTLEELHMSGCRIGPSGAVRLFHGLVLNRNLKILNLNKNQLGDAGAENIAEAIQRGLELKTIYLSYNNINAKGATALAEAIEFQNKFVVLDLSWNGLFVAGPTCHLLTMLSESTELQEINLAWNSLAGPRIANAIVLLMRVPKLQYLNLSNNKLSGESIDIIAGGLVKAKKLLTLDLSGNPMSPEDAYLVLTTMKKNAVKVQNILLDNVFVNNNFLTLLKNIKSKKARKNFTMTYGGVNREFVGTGPDFRDLILNRAEYMTKKQKKNAVDIALVFQQMVKDGKVEMILKDFIEAVEFTGARLDEALLEEFCNTFPGARSKKSKTVNIPLITEYAARKWPNRKLPPTPPPEPEPEPVVEEPKTLNKKKGKGKK